MATSLNVRCMRKCTPSQLRDYYMELHNGATEDDYTRQILAAIERGSVAPFPTFAVWLGVTKYPSHIALGLEQKFSIIVRTSSVKALGRSFCSLQWALTWNHFGGAAGLLDVFSRLSIDEVRETCKLIGKSAKGKDVAQKRHFVTQLFECLHPQVFSGLPFYTHDKRPLAKYYRHLIPSCDETLVERIVSGDLKGIWTPVSDKLLMQFHPNVMRREQFRALERNSGIDINSIRLLGLVTNYPNGRCITPDFSPSMHFAMDVLQRLVKNSTYQLHDDVAIHLIRSLLRRAIRKKLEWSTVGEIADLTMKYLDTHPTAREEITINTGDVLHLVAICWARRPGMFEKQLRNLCSGTNFFTSTIDLLAHWAKFLNKIPKCRRYALLRLCLVESIGLDLESDGDLKKFKGSLDDSLLDKLKPEEALNLFNRLRTVRGDDNLVTVRAANTVQGILSVYNTSGVDIDLYHVALLNRNGLHAEARSIATKQMELRKNKAEKASAPEQRAFYARCTLYYGIASGDLQIYRDVLQWTKRFLRDPQALPTLFPRYGHPREVITLLSGIPQAQPDLSCAKVRTRVCLANAILQSMFDTACSAIREPSFQASDWQGTLHLFQQVIQERIEKSKMLREDLSASDEEMYDVLWAATLEMLLAVETKANHSQNQRLEANIICGPLAWRGWGSSGRSDFEHAKKEKSVYRFFDNLAKARDEYWQELRSTVHPAVLTLPKSLPRGLPIQFLTAPWVLGPPDLEQLAPYIASRAKAVVFQDPATALQPVTDDEELMEAIGMLVDSYQYALQLYIPESCDKDERTKRIKAAWTHAIGPMSHGRMNEDEAVRWWKTKAPDHLKKYWPPNAKTDTENPKWPLIPDVDDPAQPTEWNPFSAGRPDRPKRDLGKLAYLDLTVVVLGRVPAITQIWSKSRLLNYIPTVPGDEVDMNQIWNSRRDMGEGGVLSALLYLEMKYGAPAGRLLQKPFPSADDTRYPSLYLDDGFQGDFLSSFNAVRHICDHFDSIPPVLVHLSAQNMMQKLWALDREEHDDHSVQELALTLLVRLGESDRPALAQDMALQTILERPEASSWHRQFLKLSYLRRMSSSEAKAYIERFADAIFTRLPAEEDKQKDTSDAMVVDATTVAARETKKEPFVKVTTIKSLAQILRDAECVDEEFALTVLSRLLERATHRDVLLHAAKTLLSMFSTCSLETADRILAVLEILIPLAGNLNESKLVTERDWKLAEDTLELPEYPGIDDELVLSVLIVEQYGSAAIESKKLTMFIDRILLPTLQCRQQQIARWLALFLRKYEVHDLNVHIPLIPQHSTTLLSSDAVCYIPKSILADLVSYIEFKTTPPEPIRAFHARLRSDPAMLSRTDVQTWFSFFPSGTDSIHAFGTFDHLEILAKPTKLKENIGITAVDVQDAFLRVFRAAIWADTPKYDRLSGGLLSRLLKGNYLVKPWWSTIGKDIVMAMIAYVDSIRTAEWLNDTNRTPVVLPDVFPWHLLLLNFPVPTNLNKNLDEDQASEKQSKLLANEIAAVINNISTSLYHNKLQQVNNYLALNPRSTTKTVQAKKQFGGRTMLYQKRNPEHDRLVRNRIIVANHMGDISTFDDTIAQVLRVEVASNLLGLVQNEWKDVTDKELKERVRVLVEGWKRSGSEDVRRIGCGFEWVFGEDEQNRGENQEFDEQSSDSLDMSLSDLMSL